MNRGHKVTVLDRFFFGEEQLAGIDGPGELRLVRDDIRYFDGKLLENHDAVIDMAAL